MPIVLQKYCGQRVKETKLLKSKKSYLNVCLVHQEPVVVWNSLFRTLTQMVLVLWVFDLKLFDFTWVQKRYTFNRNPTSDSEFWSFPVWVLCLWSSISVSLVTTSVNNWYTYNHSIPTQLFCVSLSVQHFVNYMRESVLYYKIDCIWWFCPTADYWKCSEHS